MITLDILIKAVNIPDFDPTAAYAALTIPNRLRIPTEGVIPRQAGVLVLTYPEADGLHVILTQRTSTLRSHSGQISFPGGRRNPKMTHLQRLRCAKRVKNWASAKASRLSGHFHNSIFHRAISRFSRRLPPWRNARLITLIR